MDATTIGRPTLTTRVESWECDFNDHWNARFYGRSFQLAAERVATLRGLDNPGMALLGSRTIRFHRELLAGTAVEVRSARVTSGAHAGAVAHLLSGGGRLSATALDLPGRGGEALPGVGPEIGRLAFPRGAPTPPEENSWAGSEIAETGAARPAEFDHTGAFLHEEIVRRGAYGLHAMLDRLGFTTRFEAENRIGRMVVESRITPLGACLPGTMIRVRSRIARIGRTSFATRHRLETDRCAPIACIENSLVAVDLETRRAVGVPAFLRRLDPASSYAPLRASDPTPDDATNRRGAGPK